MSLEKAIKYGKEYRKPYRRSQRFDKTCRCNGSCSYCRSNRLHAINVALEKSDYDMSEYGFIEDKNMEINEIIEKRKVLNNDSDEIVERQLVPVLEDGKTTIHDFVDGQDLGYHYRLEPELFKSLADDYKAGNIDLDLFWKYIEDSLVERL